MAGNIRDNPGRIIVKNYPTNTTSRDLQIMFEKYGKIDDLFTPKERDSDKPRNFSFICYRKIENAEEAIRGMNGREIEGHKLLVEFARRSGSFRGRGFDRGGRGRGRKEDFRRHSGSPRHFRSRSASPKDRWRERHSDQSSRYPPHAGERDVVFVQHDPYGPPPSAQPPFRMGYPPPQGGPSPMGDPNRVIRVDAPPHHPHDGPPSSGGHFNLPPHHSNMGPRDRPPGRKILLDTPQGPPPGRLFEGGPSGQPPPQGPPPYHPHSDHPSSRPNYTPQNRDVPPYYGGGGGPPHDRNNNPPSREPIQDNYKHERSHYDDHFQNYPRPHERNPPSHPNEYRDDFDGRNNEYSTRRMPVNDSYSYQQNDGFRAPSYSGSASHRYRSPPPPSHGNNPHREPFVDRNYPTNTEYNTRSGYNYDDAGRPAGNQVDYYTTERDYGGSGPQQQTSFYTQRQPGNFRNAGPDNIPHKGAPKDVNPHGSFYRSEQSRREHPYSGGGGGQHPPSSYPPSQSTSYITKSASNTSNSNRSGTFGSPPSKYPMYSMSSFSTGYGGTPPSPRSSSPKSQKHPPAIGGSLSDSGNRANTGYMPSQNYTKPGPPF